MKQIIIVAMFLIGMEAKGQSYELSRLLLDIEKLAQLKDILSDLKKGYEILTTGYNTIRDISQGNFNLNKAYLDGLLAISPGVKKYKRIAEIIDYQARIVTEYKAAFNQFKQSKIFNLEEIVYLGGVYSNLFNQSLKNLDNLLDVVTDSKLRMTDDERLNAIDGIYANAKDQWLFLRQFNSNTSLLALQRACERGDVETVEGYHGLR